MKLDTCFLCKSDEYITLHKGTRGGHNDIDVLQCAKCGLVRLSESMDDSMSFYENSGMRKCAGELIGDLRISTRKDDERRYLFAENMIEGKALLDFGCGDGGFLLRAKEIAKYVEGVELEAEIRRQINEEGIVCKKSLADTGKFDVITAFHVLEHLENPLTYLAEMKKHLVPSGMLLLEVPNADDALLKLYQSSAFADFTYWHCHVYLYTNATLAELAKQAGFKVVFIEQVQRYPLANHLHWLAKGKPGGHHVWTYLQDDALDKAYGDKLAGLGMADTIIAGFAALS